MDSPWCVASSTYAMIDELDQHQITETLELSKASLFYLCGVFYPRGGCCLPAALLHVLLKNTPRKLVRRSLCPQHSQYTRCQPRQALCQATLSMYYSVQSLWGLLSPAREFFSTLALVNGYEAQLFVACTA